MKNLPEETEHYISSFYWALFISVKYNISKIYNETSKQYTLYHDNKCNHALLCIVRHPYSLKSNSLKNKQY